jgi:hypothetical protein
MYFDPSRRHHGQVLFQGFLPNLNGDGRRLSSPAIPRLFELNAAITRLSTQRRALHRPRLIHNP